MNDTRSLYVDLLKRSVSNSIHDDDLDMLRGKFKLNQKSGKLQAVEPGQVSRHGKYYGEIWPTRAFTMIGTPRLDNIQSCIEEIIDTDVPGDLIETGVWRGGAVIFMRGLLKAYGITDRTVWVADSFEGLPKPNFDLYPQESKSNFHIYEPLAVSLEEVQANFRRFNLLDGQVKFLKGWFKDTLPEAPIEKLALMRLDGDMYESTMDALVNLYDKLSAGGFVIIDDYNVVECCDQAVHDFRKERKITAELRMIKGFGAFWKKSPEEVPVAQS